MLGLLGPQRSTITTHRLMVPSYQCTSTNFFKIWSQFAYFLFRYIHHRQIFNNICMDTIKKFLFYFISFIKFKGRITTFIMKKIFQGCWESENLYVCVLPLFKPTQWWVVDIKDTKLFVTTVNIRNVSDSNIFSMTVCEYPKLNLFTDVIPSLYLSKKIPWKVVIIFLVVVPFNLWQVTISSCFGQNISAWAWFKKWL